MIESRGDALPNIGLHGGMTFPADKPWLGGHGDRVHTDSGAALWLVREFGVRSVVDIGCATGGMRHVFLDHGAEEWLGIDGDYRLKGRESVVIHDYTTGPYAQSIDTVAVQPKR